jgi:hypothetical protein
MSPESLLTVADNPLFQHRLLDPEDQTSPLFQSSVILRPVADAVAHKLVKVCWWYFNPITSPIRDPYSCNNAIFRSKSEEIIPSFSNALHRYSQSSYRSFGHSREELFGYRQNSVYEG